MKKQKIFFYSIIVCSSLIALQAKAGSETPASSTQPQVLGLKASPVPPIIAAVSEAKTKLGEIALNHSMIPVYRNIKNKKTGKTAKTISGYKLGDKDIALAILDPGTNQIITTVGRLNGKKMLFPDPAVDVKLAYFNGVNSRFRVNVPANGQVVALKYLISPKESGSKAAIENSLYEAVYVPYSQNFNDPAVLSYGADYLNGIIARVAKDLENTPSRSVPGLTITQAIKPALIKSLVYAEHTDTAKILKGEIQNTVDQLNSLFALNEGDTYKYSVSSAGARGIAQFIPSTYSSLVSRHSDADLIPDFIAGMSDHKNSIKAMYLLLDDYAGAIRVKASLGFAEGRIFEYGAASYNGGTSRVAKAVNLFGENWNLDRSAEINSLKSDIRWLKSKIKKTADKKIKSALNSQLSSATSKLADLQAGSLRNETVSYLQKIYKVIQYFNTQGEQLALAK